MKRQRGEGSLLGSPEKRTRVVCSTVVDLCSFLKLPPNGFHFGSLLPEVLALVYDWLSDSPSSQFTSSSCSKYWRGVFYDYLPSIKVDGPRMGRQMKTSRLEEIASFSRLTCLNLSGCRYLTFDLFPFLSKLPKLTSLILSGCQGILLQGMPELAQLTQLQELDLSFCMQSFMGMGGSWESVNVNEATAALKMLLGKLKSLTRLHLDGWPLSMESFKCLNTNCRDLQYLSLKKWKLNVVVSLTVFRAFKDLTKLKRLLLAGCGVTVRQHKEIQKIFPEANINIQT